jgi:hypothetical protein
MGVIRYHCEPSFTSFNLSESCGQRERDNLFKVNSGSLNEVAQGRRTAISFHQTTTRFTLTISIYFLAS